MRILDTNILIYASQEQFSYLRPLLLDSDNFISDITKVETLGFHKMKSFEKVFLEDIFRILNSLPVSEEVIQKAIELKQSKKMDLGDALIAATAIVSNFSLLTTNIKDFANIPHLEIENPTI